MNKVRCAIYTRKSSEEGLEQDFNSLHAQREACAAYVLSQASEGWSLLPGEYDDGGLSGGTLERPALQRLLANIDAGKIDIVVVYKVDRLTRSLLDFSKLVEAFDSASTSFVSVTQSFNTTTSMGRLTLNMLLSFAQFEREVTAERIRDKIAASKAKGMWMGGVVPLGYEADGRTLKIVEEHAELIRELFQRYREVGNVRLLTNQLDNECVHLPQRTMSTGRAMGGGKFTRGQIYKILSNPIYLGEIHHKGKVYEGKHEAIVDRDLWDSVQAELADNRQGSQRAATVRSASMLAGLVFDTEGQPLIASHACKGKVRYRYYVSKALQLDLESNGQGIRIPALELEKAVAEAVAQRFDDPLRLVHAADLAAPAAELERIMRIGAELAVKFRKRDRGLIKAIVERLTIDTDCIRLQLRTAAIANAVGADLTKDAADTLEHHITARLTRSGRALRIVQDSGKAISTPEPQLHLAKLLNNARMWWQEMCDGQLTAAELSRRDGINKSYLSRALRLNFLAPDIVEAILAGDVPTSLDAKGLLAMQDLPLSWRDQQRELHLA
ncbi:MAG TPA: recombinase family protein [Sphingomicrobium sp.]|nr:recombinase family protein [Sphingomicrobium sp.]